MRKDFIKAINSLVDLFQNLCDQDKLTDQQITKFNNAQKKLVEFFNYLENTPVELPWNDKEFQLKWEEWKRYKAGQFKDYYRPVGEKQALNRLVSESKNNRDEAIRLIDFAMGMTWKGIYHVPDKPQKLENKKPNKHGSDFN